MLMLQISEHGTYHIRNTYNTPKYLWGDNNFEIRELTSSGSVNYHLHCHFENKVSGCLPICLHYYIFSQPDGVRS